MRASLTTEAIGLEHYGKFELITCLARGGMAEVFLARQQGEGRFERLVVIKRILPELAGDQRFVEMFLEEARIAALLDHPNVIPIYDLGRVGDTLFIAMPFVLGLTLQAMLEQASHLRLPIPTEIYCEVIRQALVGLHYAHERKGLDGEALELVHRDVSPGNLMINEHGRVILLDFGIATSSAGGGAQATTLRGKLAYMSPEQVRGEPFDRRADLFAVGVIFWELLVGRRLFQRRSEVEVLNAIADEPITDALDHRPELPEGLVAILRRALQRDPRQRYATAAEMLADLERTTRALHYRVEPKDLAAFLHGNFGDSLQEQARTVQQARRAAASAAGAATTGAGAGGKSARRRGWLLGLVGVALVALAITILAVFRQAPWEPTLEGPPLRFGMIPYLPKPVLTEELSPLLRFLERKLGRPVTLVYPGSYEELVSGLVNGTVDVADLSAYPFILARRKDPEIQPLAVGMTMSQKTYESYLVVPRQSAARQIADLQGSRICYVDRTSTSGYLMPRVMIRRAGFDPDRFFEAVRFSGDHYTALREMLAGRCDAASVGSGSFLSANQVGISTGRVRILQVSPTLPYGAYCASSSLPRELTRQLRRLLLDLDVKQVFGRPVLGRDLMISGFDPVDPTAFNELEREVLATERGALDGGAALGLDSAGPGAPQPAE